MSRSGLLLHYVLCNVSLAVPIIEAVITTHCNVEKSNIVSVAVVFSVLAEHLITIWSVFCSVFLLVCLNDLCGYCCKFR